MPGIERNPSEPKPKTGELPFLEVDRNTPEILSALTSAPIFKKYGKIQSRPAIVGEEIKTILKSGFKETKGVAQEGDRVMTNPLGEEYLIPKVEHLARYDAETGEAKGHVRAIRNPFGAPIEIIAHWGERQNGTEDCWIVANCDEEGNVEGEPRLIGGAEFASTYREVTRS